MRPTRPTLALALALTVAAAAPAAAQRAGNPVPPGQAPAPTVVVEDTAPVAGGILLPIVAVVVLAAAIVASD